MANARNLRQYDITIEMAVKGSNTFQNDMIKMQKQVADLKTRFQDMGIGGAMNKEMESVLKRVKSYYKQIEDIKAKISSAKMEGDDTAEMQQLQKLKVVYKNLLNESGKLNKDMELLQQVAKSSFNSQIQKADELAQRYAKLGGMTNKVSDQMQKAQQQAVAANSAAPIANSNKELEKRIKLMEKIAKYRATTDSMGFDSKEITDYNAQLSAMYQDLRQMKTPLAEIDSLMERININPKVLGDLSKFGDKVDGNIKKLKDMGASDKRINDLRVQFEQLHKAALKAGDATGIKELNNSLKEEKALLLQLEPLYKKIANSKLSSGDKTAAKAQLNGSKSTLLAGGADTEAEKAKINAIKMSITEMTTEAKKYNNQVEQSIKGLERQKTKLIEEKQILQALITQNKDFLSPKDMAKAVAELDKLDNKVQEYGNHVTAIRKLGFVDKTVAAQSIALVEKAKLEVMTLKREAGDIKVKLKLSGNFEEFKKYSNELKKDMAGSLKSPGVKADPQAYQRILDLIKQINVEQQKAQQGGQSSLTNSKKSVGVMAERYDKYLQINAQADKLVQKMLEDKNITGDVATAANQVVLELRKAAEEQLNLNTSSRKHTTILKEAVQFENSLNATLREQAATKKQLFNLENQLKTKLEEVNRLMNSKQQYATAEALKKAADQAKQLEAELKKVKTLQDSLNNISAQTIGGKIDSSQLTKAREETEKLTKEFSNTSRKVKEVKAELAGLSQMKWGANILKRAVAYAGMYAGIYQVISVLRKGVEAVVEFDTQVRTMQAVFDVTAERAKILAGELYNLGTAYGGSIADINNAALALGRAGIATKDVSSATEIVIKMAKLTGDTIATSASAIITYQQVFIDTGLTLEQMGDQLAYVANQSRLSTQDIGTFSNYALAAAKAAGLSMEAINAMATAYSNAGVNASTIGTQIRRFSSLMRDNSTAAQEFFLKIGTTQKAFSSAMQSGKKEADSAMRGIATSLNNLSDKEFQKVIHGMDILASNSITLLRNNADEFLRHFKNLNDGVAGEIDKANLIAEGYQASFEIMKNSASEAFIAMTEASAPMIQSIIDKFAEFFNFVKENSKAIAHSFDVMLDTAKWLAFGIIVGKTGLYIHGLYKTVKTATLSLMAINTALAATSAGTTGLALAMRTARTAVVGLRVAMVALLTSNPVGWALLAVGAIGALAYSMYDAEEAATEMTKAMTLAGQVRDNSKTMAEEKTKLAGIMEQLATATGKSRTALIEQAAASEDRIVAMSAENKVLQQQIELEERRAKIDIAKTRIETIEVRIKNGEKNNQNVDDLKKMLGRLKENYTLMEIQLSFEKAMAKFDSAEAKNMINGINYMRDQMELNPTMDPAQVKAFEQSIAILKQKLASYGIGETIINSEAVEKELNKMVNSVETRLAVLTAKKHEIEIKTKLTSADKEMIAAIDEQIAALKQHMDSQGGLSLEIVSDKSLKQLGEFASQIKKQLKAGFDVDDAMVLFETNMKGMMSTLTVDAELFAGNFEKNLKKALSPQAFTDIQPMLTKFKGLIDKLKTATTADEQSTIFAQTELELQKMYSVVQTENPKALAALDELIGGVKRFGAQSQEVAAASADVFKAAFDLPNQNKAIDDMIKKMREIRGVEAEVNMTKAEINAKLGKGVDLTQAIKNGELSAKDAAELQIDIKKILIDLENQLLSLVTARAAVEGADMGQAQKAEAYAWLAKEQEGAIKKAKAATKNLKAANTAYAKTVKHASSASKSASSHADEVERANRALTKMEAKYQQMLGNSNQAVMLTIEAEFSKLDEYAKKAGASIDELNRLKQLYLQAEMTDTKTKIQDDAVSESGLDYLQTASKYQKRYEQLEKYYAKVEELQKAKEAQLLLSRQEGDMTEAEYQTAKMELDLAKHQEYLTKKEALDQAYFEMNVQTYGAMAGELAGIMKSMYDSGLIKTKGWLKAMQALQVAQAIMSTYTAAANALTVGVPPWNYINVAFAIAKGMAQVAQIKAQKFHTGGYAAAPNANGMGGKRDDEVNAVLQKGEYVLSRTDVQLIKSANRKEINSMKVMKDQAQQTNTSDSPSQQTREMNMLADAMKPEVVIVNSMDPAVVEDWATSRRGREIINNVVNA